MARRQIVISLLLLCLMLIGRGYAQTGTSDPERRNEEIRSIVAGMRERGEFPDKGKLLITIHSETYSYSRDRGKGSYELTGREVDIETNYIEGIGSIADNTRLRHTLYLMPDPHENEYDRIDIRSRGGKFFLDIDARRWNTVQLGTLSYTPEIEFVQGNWKDFQAGRVVTVRFTESGLELMRREMEHGARRAVARTAQLIVAPVFAGRLIETLTAAGVDLSGLDFEERVGAVCGIFLDIPSIPNHLMTVSKKEIRCTVAEPVIIHAQIELAPDIRL